MKARTCNMAWGLFADSHPGTDFKERIIHLPYTQAQAECLLSRHFRRWRCRETACKGHTMKKYCMCIFIVVTGALFTPHGEGWKITDNALNVTINISSK